MGCFGSACWQTGKEVAMVGDMLSPAEDWPGPSAEDRASWEAYRLTPAGEGLPPYDDAPDGMRALWWGIQRLTFADIGAAVERISARGSAAP